MKTLWMMVLLAAAPAFAEEVAVDFTGTGSDGQAVQFSFDLNTLSGTFTHSDHFPFQALGVQVSDWSGSIDGQAVPLSPTTFDFTNDASGHAGGDFTGIPVNSFLWDVDIVNQNLDFSGPDPLASLFLNQLTSSYPGSTGLLDGVAWSTTSLTVTPAAVSAPEPGTLPLLLLGAAFLTIRMRLATAQRRLFPFAVAA